MKRLLFILGVGAVLVLATRPAMASEGPRSLPEDHEKVVLTLETIPDDLNVILATRPPRYYRPRPYWYYGPPRRYYGYRYGPYYYRWDYGPDYGPRHVYRPYYGPGGVYYHGPHVHLGIRF